MGVHRRLLAFDTAGSACSAAVWAGGEVVAERLEPMVRGHSERLVPMIQEVMAEAGVGFEALDGLAVTLGPGAFTGIRIGLATARGLALARGLRVLGLSSFEAIAGAVDETESQDRILVAALESKRRDVYIQSFSDPITAATPPQSILPEKVERAVPEGAVLLAGDGADHIAPALMSEGRDVVVSKTARHTDSSVVARLAAGRPAAEWLDRAPEPLYLRAPDVTLPRPLRS